MAQHSMQYAKASATHFIQMLMDGRREISEEEAEARRQVLNLDALRLPCVAVCIALDYASFAYDVRDRLVVECEAYVGRFLERQGYTFCTNVNTYDNIQILLHARETAALDDVFIKLHDKLRMEFSIELFIGIGSLAESYGKIAISAGEASEMLAYKYQYADRGVINIANLVRMRYNLSSGTNEMYERVLGCFKDGNLGKMALRLDVLIEEVRRRPRVSGTSIRRTLVELTVSMLHIASSANVDVDDILRGEDPYQWIMQQNETPIITRWFMNLASQLLAEMQSQKQQRQKKVIEDACAYIDAHIGENTLGLQTVADNAGLTGPYFSQLFKEEKKIGLNNYIAQRRVELAMHLLRETNLKNDEIALRLGFARTNYFSSVFRKLTGMTPGAYRKSSSDEMKS